MEVTRDGIIFKWEEIRDVLPSGLQDSWRIRQILGNDARRTFDVGVDRIEFGQRRMTSQFMSCPMASPDHRRTRRSPPPSLFART